MKKTTDLPDLRTIFKATSKMPVHELNKVLEEIKCQIVDQSERAEETTMQKQLRRNNTIEEILGLLDDEGIMPEHLIRNEVIESVLEDLESEGITPEELVAFSNGRHRRAGK